MALNVLNYGVYEEKWWETNFLEGNGYVLLGFVNSRMVQWYQGNQGHI